MARAWYATRQRAMRAADVSAAAYTSADWDAFVESASQQVDSLLKLGDETRPGLAPWTGTITFDHPVSNNDDSFRLYLDANRLYSLTSMTTDDGADTITADVLPWPAGGPPYSAIDIDESSGSILTFSSGRGQRSAAVTGVWCGCVVNERTLTTWQLSGSINASATTAVLNAPAGVGSIVRLDSERMIVTEQSWADSGQNATLTLLQSDQTITVADASIYFPGEELLIDGERVLVQDRAGTTLIVKRAVGGTSLAAHSNADIYWARSCTVQRGALGTTAASHSSGAQIYIYAPPSLAEQLTVAYALDQAQQEKSGYARTVTNGESVSEYSGRGIAALEKRVLSAYGRQLRLRSVG